MSNSATTAVGTKNPLRRKDFHPPVLKKHDDLPVITAGSVHIYRCTKYISCA